MEVSLIEYYRIPKPFTCDLPKGGRTPREFTRRYLRGEKRFADYRWSMCKVCNRGGMTRVVVQDGDFSTVGEAVCSVSDNFCYRAGRIIATRRARQAMFRKLAGA